MVSLYTEQNYTPNRLQNNFIWGGLQVMYVKNVAMDEAVSFEPAL